MLDSSVFPERPISSGTLNKTGQHRLVKIANLLVLVLISLRKAYLEGRTDET